MSTIGLNGNEFQDLAKQILDTGNRLRFQARGDSMLPWIQDGDILKVAPLFNAQVRRGDVLLVEASEGRLLAHRVVKVECRDGVWRYQIKGDVSSTPDGWFMHGDILGRVEFIEHESHVCKLSTRKYLWKVRSWLFLTSFTAEISWLPGWFRRRVRRWLLAG